MVAIAQGRLTWQMTRDEEGHRYYDLISRVATNSVDDGPYMVMMAAGLPAVGAPWSFGGDFDPWAYCWPTMEVTPIVEDEPNKWWLVQQRFSTKPHSRCQDVQIENPLMEPPRLSGSFVKRTKLVRSDRFSLVIHSSSLEPIQGIEKDVSSPSVTVEINQATFVLADLCPIIDTLNDAELWGFDPRCVKLSNLTWSRNVYGVCGYYYTLRFDFDIKEDGWDETKVLDRGFKKFDTRRHPNVGTGDPERRNPANFVLIRDKNGEKVTEPLLLDGFGNVLTDIDNPVYIPKVELYDETNFLEFGIPSTLV